MPRAFPQVGIGGGLDLCGSDLAHRGDGGMGGIVRIHFDGHDFPVRGLPIRIAIDFRGMSLGINPQNHRMGGVAGGQRACHVFSSDLLIADEQFKYAARFRGGFGFKNHAQRRGKRNNLPADEPHFYFSSDLDKAIRPASNKARNWVFGPSNSGYSAY